MTGKLDDVWATRDFPVLVEVTKRIDAGAKILQLSDVADALDLTTEQVRLAAAALSRRGLVKADGPAEEPILYFTEVHGDAYLLTGLHPNGDDAISRLVDALRQAADQVDDPAEKSRLRTLADNVGSVSRDVLSGVLSAVITASMNG